MSRLALLPFALAVATACYSSPFHTEPVGRVAPDAATVSDSAVVVEGVVVDHETGDSLSGATVSLGAGPSGVRGRGTRVTDEGGGFSFEGVPEGTYRLLVAAQGYRDMADTLRVPVAGGLELILPLSTGTARLEPIIVEPPLPEAVPGYERRRAGGSRFLVTREEILERRPRFLTELLNHVPGGIVVRTPPHGYTLLLRGQCRPGIWVDGVRLAGVQSVDQILTPQDVQALEVYHGFELPVEFGVDACGGVLAWTRSAPALEDRGYSASESGGVLGNLIRVAVIVIAIFVLTR